MTDQVLNGDSSMAASTAAAAYDSELILSLKSKRSRQLQLQKQQRQRRQLLTNFETFKTLTMSMMSPTVSIIVVISMTVLCNVQVRQQKNPSLSV
jgi:hypothetical protein